MQFQLEQISKEAETHYQCGHTCANANQTVMNTWSEIELFLVPAIKDTVAAFSNATITLHKSLVRLVEGNLSVFNQLPALLAASADSDQFAMSLKVANGVLSASQNDVSVVNALAAYTTCRLVMVEKATEISAARQGHEVRVKSAAETRKMIAEEEATVMEKQQAIETNEFRRLLQEHHKDDKVKAAKQLRDRRTALVLKKETFNDEITRLVSEERHETFFEGLRAGVLGIKINKSFSIEKYHRMIKTVDKEVADIDKQLSASDLELHTFEDPIELKKKQKQQKNRLKELRKREMDDVRQCLEYDASSYLIADEGRDSFRKFMQAMMNQEALLNALCESQLSIHRTVRLLASIEVAKLNPSLKLLQMRGLVMVPIVKHALSDPNPQFDVKRITIVQTEHYSNIYAYYKPIVSQTANLAPGEKGKAQGQRAIANGKMEAAAVAAGAGSDEDLSLM
eukprot:GHVN01056761.1.p1 GENE.GHVN01056761.1~~GHVN01056761.1.p1  ORF type:complete len:454 (-),score=60.49 GHVN01056761.1:407-1768(-)